MAPELITKIFEKLDNEKNGKIYLNSFIVPLLLLNSPILDEANAKSYLEKLESASNGDSFIDYDKFLEVFFEFLFIF